MTDDTRKREKVFVDREGGADDDGKFRVLANGYIEYWTLDDIKRSIDRNDDVREWDRG